MIKQFETALEKVEVAAQAVFAADRRVRAVGVGKCGNRYGYVAVRNVKAPSSFAVRIENVPPLHEFDGIPVVYTDSHMDPVHLARVPLLDPSSPQAKALLPEQAEHRPPACGLQVQNYDDDQRTGEIARGYMIIGTLGCFVRIGGSIAILSNNHVLAGENRGIIHKDRIAQPGGLVLQEPQHIATLTQFVPLQASPAGGHVADGTAPLNEIDAAIATLTDESAYTQSYLLPRHALAPKGTAPAKIGDKVHKVGRTTGLTFGTVTQIGAVVGPVGYDTGMCWFRRSIVIQTVDGSAFSDHGDSGSAIVRDDGKVIGLLYGGDGTNTFACAIDAVLSQLECELALSAGAS